MTINDLKFSLKIEFMSNEPQEGNWLKPKNSTHMSFRDIDIEKINTILNKTNFEEIANISINYGYEKPIRSSWYSNAIKLLLTKQKTLDDYKKDMSHDPQDFEDLKKEYEDYLFDTTHPTVYGDFEIGRNIKVKDRKKYFLNEFNLNIAKIKERLLLID